MISIIVAMSQNRVIGRDNTMPWHIKEDLKYFRKLTLDHTVVMGRKTYEEIAKNAKKYNRSVSYLPNRKNVVITRDSNFSIDRVRAIHSLKDIKKLKGDVFIIGGESIYDQTINIACLLYVTYIKKDFEGDTFFPRIEKSDWKLQSVKKKKDDENPLDYEFRKYVRI